MDGVKSEMRLWVDGKLIDPLTIDQTTYAKSSCGANPWITLIFERMDNGWDSARYADGRKSSARLLIESARAAQLAHELGLAVGVIARAHERASDDVGDAGVARERFELGELGRVDVAVDRQVLLTRR